MPVLTAGCEMLESRGRPRELHLKKELTAIRRARCLRDPETSSSWKSPVTGRSVANAVWNYSDGNCGREVQEERNGYQKDAGSETVSGSPMGRGIGDGERGLLHNWRNQGWTDAAEAAVDTLDAAETDLGRSNRRGRELRTCGVKSEASDVKEPVDALQHRGEGARMSKPGRRDRASRKSARNSRKDGMPKQCATGNHRIQKSAQALSRLSLEEESFGALELWNGEDVGFSRVHRRAANSDCNSRAGSPLLTTEVLKSCEQNSKDHRRPRSVKLLKDTSRQKDDLYTPPSTCSYNRNDDRNPSILGSWDGTAFSGDDEMDGMDLPRQGCGIPCYWSRTPKHRGSGGSFSPSLSDSVRRKVGNMVSRNQTALQKESPVAAYNYKRSAYMFDSRVEGVPLLTDGGEGEASSGEVVSDGQLTDFGELDLEAASKLDRRRRIRYRSQEPPELATSGSRELAIYEDKHRSLSQKYRPRSFDELVGQSIVVQTLVNAILRGKIAPVYLFQGPRGTGKTTTARIFAAALNCLSPENLSPCGLCRECTDFASGKSMDVREVDAANSNGIDRVKALLKNVALGPSFARFKVFIIDECHLLAFETWTALLKSLEEPPGRVVFIFITTDPDKLPRTVISRCQKYLFPKIKDTEVVSRLRKLATEENLDVDLDALDLIAAKSDGSLRDAETMLEQLSLLGQRITLSLVHELVGVVSDEKLLDLLELALSADTARTVRRARDLIDSGVEPMTLMSQLATLIMDILAGSYKLADIKCKGAFFHRHALTEEILERLRQALKILSEAEKQLRVSNDQTTWLTAALLQFGSGRSVLVPTSAGTSVAQSPVVSKERNIKEQLCIDSSARQVLDQEKQFQAEFKELDSMAIPKPRMGNEKCSLKNFSFMYYHEADKGVPVSNVEAQIHASNYSPMLNGCVGGSPTNIEEHSESGQTEFSCLSPNKLDNIWRRAIEECNSNTLRQLLHTQGKLVSVYTSEGFAIVQLEFWHPDHKSRAERCVKTIANLMQLVLGCNVDISISLASLPDELENVKSRKGDLSKQRQWADVIAASRGHGFENTSVNSNQGRTHGKRYGELPYVLNGPETFLAIPHGACKESPMPAQCFQAEAHTIVSMAETRDPISPCSGKQGLSITGKDSVIDEQRLESAWLQAAEKWAPGLTDILNPEKNQVLSRDSVDLQNGNASCGTTGMMPLGVALQQNGRMLNHEHHLLESSGVFDSEKHRSMGIDRPDSVCSSSVDQATFPSSLEEGNFWWRSGANSGSILCWKVPKVDQEKAKQQRRRRRRKSAFFLWVVPCAKAKR